MFSLKKFHTEASAAKLTRIDDAHNLLTSHRWHKTPGGQYEHHEIPGHSIHIDSKNGTYTHKIAHKAQKLNTLMDHLGTMSKGIR